MSAWVAATADHDIDTQIAAMSALREIGAPAVPALVERYAAASDTMARRGARGALALMCPRTLVAILSAREAAAADGAPRAMLDSVVNDIRSRPASQQALIGCTPE